MSIQQALDNESKVRQIITQQEINGVNFDKEKAEGYISELSKRKDTLYGKIRPHLKLEVITPYTVPVSRPYLKNGTHSSGVLNWFRDDVPDIGGPFTRCEFNEPDLGSRKKLIAQLESLGWSPRAFTEKGNPKLTVDGQPCPSLMDIDSEIGQDIAHWYIYNHRQSQIQGWIDKLRDDGKLTAEAITIGTPTYRFRHKTVVNVPKASPDVVFGTEMRSLFIPSDRYVMVGHDASGLELRMLAHFINDEEYTKVVTEGDPHTYHQRLAKLDTRDQAKTFIYAFNYGAGALLIGIGVNSDISKLEATYSSIQVYTKLKSLNKNANKDGMIHIGKNTYVRATEETSLRALDGDAIKKTFLSYNPKLKKLIDDVTEAARRGWLKGIDGRKIMMRRDYAGKVQVHKGVNTLLQTTGAIVMKYSMVILDRWIREMELSSRKVIDMHDEGQYEVLPEDAELHGMLACYSIEEAGRQLGVRLPLAGEYKIGNSWAETH